MRHFIKEIYKTDDDVSFSTPSLSTPSALETACNAQVTVRVTTTIPIKVNIFSTFQTGASWLGDTFLTGPNKISANLVDSELSYTERYNFGIDASNSNGTSNTSSITIQIKDFTTNSVIDSYTLTRNHSTTQC